MTVLREWHEPARSVSCPPEPPAPPARGPSPRRLVKHHSARGTGRRFDFASLPVDVGPQRSLAAVFASGANLGKTGGRWGYNTAWPPLATVRASWFAASTPRAPRARRGTRWRGTSW